MKFSLDNAVKNLVASVQSYESDTFSASAEGIGQAEAEQIAAEVIYSLLFERDGCPIQVDGGVLSEIWTGICNCYEGGHEAYIAEMTAIADEVIDAADRGF
ncbi:MAG: hypothetical protein AAFY26_25910 [Cyanobacteria bacterium J06638_22]